MILDLESQKIMNGPDGVGRPGNIDPANNTGAKNRCSARASTPREIRANYLCDS
jgi:hypothetical protein